MPEQPGQFAADPWWSDHRNLALTAAHTPSEVVYMLEKPGKHNDDFNLAAAEATLPEDLS